jgi:hypothetical protein
VNNSITVTETIFIKQTPDIVWDFTQDYTKRSSWDKSILKIISIQETPKRIVEVKGKGNLNCKFQYKQYDRPFKTSLVMTDVSSPIIAGGGGSWKYTPSENGTLWTQTNTLILKNHFLLKWIKPLIAFQLRRSTQKALKLAKRIMEP